MNTIKTLGPVTAYAYAVSKGYSGTEEEFANLLANYTDVIQMAEESKEAATLALKTLATDTASGAVASFSDGAEGLAVKSLVLGIEPSQDLHGQSSPWPAGGGKNKLPSLADTKTVNGVTFTHNSDGTYKVNGTASANTTLYFTNKTAQVETYPLPSAAYTLSGCPSGGSSSTYRLITYLYKGDTYTNVAVSDTGSGGNITAADFDGARTAIDIKSGTTVNNLVFSPMIRLASVSDATYAPYSNVCPISGHTDVVVTRTGKNLIPKSNSSSPTTIKGVTAVRGEDGTWTLNGTCTENGDIGIRSGTAGFFTLPTGTYKLSGCPSNGGTTTYRLSIRISNPNVSNRYVMCIGPDISFTINEGDYISSVYMEVKNGYVFNNLVFSPMIRASTDDATYEPYQSDTLSLPLPTAAGTVYGGTLDVTSGKLTVTHGIVDIGSLSWSVYGSGAHVRYGTTGIQSAVLAPASDSTLCDITCEALKSDTATRIYNQTEGNTIGVGNTGVLYAYTPIYATAADFKTAMSGVDLVYPLATPIEYTLTPAQLKTLKGSNNVWQDSGTISVEYFADTKLYINKALAALA